MPQDYRRRCRPAYRQEYAASEMDRPITGDRSWPPVDCVPRLGRQGRPPERGWHQDIAAQRLRVGGVDVVGGRRIGGRQRGRRLLWLLGRLRGLGSFEVSAPLGQVAELPSYSRIATRSSYAWQHQPGQEDGS